MTDHPDGIPGTHRRSFPFKRYMAAAGAVCLLAGSLAGCGRRPSDVLPDEALTALLVDMYKAEAYASSDPVYSFNDSMRMVLRQGVLADHHTDEATFNRSLDWYGRNIDRMGDIYEEVNDRLEKEGTTSVRSPQSTPGASLWEGSARLTLNPSNARNRFAFDIPGSRLNNPKDNEIVWEFTTPVLPGRITTFVGADYSDGTYSYSSRTFNTPGTASVTLTLEPGKKLLRVFGQSTYIPVHRETVFVDSIRVMARPSRIPGRVPMQ